MKKFISKYNCLFSLATVGPIIPQCGPNVTTAIHVPGYYIDKSYEINWLFVSLIFIKILPIPEIVDNHKERTSKMQLLEH